jgi:hypothetical protein
MEFQRYLEKSGVVETITRVLAALYELPEKPLDSNEFIRDFLSVSAPDDVEKLRQTFTSHQTRLNQLDIDIETVRHENMLLKRKVQELENPGSKNEHKKLNTQNTSDGKQIGNGTNSPALIYSESPEDEDRKE